jgi:hypothetical protein
MCQTALVGFMNRDAFGRVVEHRLGLTRGMTLSRFVG